MYGLSRQVISAQQEKEMKELRDVQYAMDLRYDERETDAAHSFQSLMDELKNKVQMPDYDRQNDADIYIL